MNRRIRYIYNIKEWLNISYHTYTTNFNPFTYTCYPKSSRCFFIPKILNSGKWILRHIFGNWTHWTVTTFSPSPHSGNLGIFTLGNSSRWQKLSPTNFTYKNILLKGSVYLQHSRQPHYFTAPVEGAFFMPKPIIQQNLKLKE